MPIVGATVIALGAGIACGVLRILGIQQSPLRQRPWTYPVLLAVTAAFYVLFAFLGGAVIDVVIEACIAVVFLVVACSGSRIGVIAGFAVHAVFDAIHPWLLGAHPVPSWWPAFCFGFDGAIVLWLARHTLRTAYRDALLCL